MILMSGCPLPDTNCPQWFSGTWKAPPSRVWFSTLFQLQDLLLIQLERLVDAVLVESKALALAVVINPNCAAALVSLGRGGKVSGVKPSLLQL
jgi:hypothetical protein